MEHDSAVEPVLPVGLPRRSARQHMAPQLRAERSAGHGSPFSAFVPATGPDGDEPGADVAPADNVPAAAPADFRAGARRGRRGRSAADADSRARRTGRADSDAVQRAADSW